MKIPAAEETHSKALETTCSGLKESLKSKELSQLINWPWHSCQLPPFTSLPRISSFHFRGPVFIYYPGKLWWCLTFSFNIVINLFHRGISGLWVHPSDMPFLMTMGPLLQYHCVLGWDASVRPCTIANVSLRLLSDLEAIWTSDHCMDLVAH